MWFDDWASLVQIAVKSVIGFAAVVLLLRVAGKRSITKLNAFDLILIFTVGSILATTIINPDTTLSEGLWALALLVGLQWLTAWLSSRSVGFRTLIKSQPTLLVYDGEMLLENMKKERILEVEVQSALRQHGIHDIKNAKAVVLETEGKISVLAAKDGDDVTSLQIEGIDVPARKGPAK